MAERIKTTDWVLKQIKNEGVEHVFGMTGGAITNQIDAFSRSDVKYIAMQHEQAAAMAVEAYSKLKGYGAAMATSAPGGTNLITGIYGCWFDSVPSLFITGQVGTFDMKHNKIRQKGFQEAEMVRSIKPCVKFGRLVKDVESLPNLVERAIKKSKQFRQGPVHLDIPMDIQMAEMDDVQIKTSPELVHKRIHVQEVIKAIKKAERPILIIGNGVRASGATAYFSELADILGWPILPTWGYGDYQHENRLEVFGVYGNRGSNYAIANSDLLISVGARLDTREAGSNPKTFAREAVKIVIDVDPAELKKDVVVPSLPIHADATDFLLSMMASPIDAPDVSNWLQECKDMCHRYPLVTKEHLSDTKINPYMASRIISDEAKEGDIMLLDTGGTLSWVMQSWQLKKDQRLISSFGNSPMGFSLPASIGVWFATGKAPICINGDGGMQVNIQELQTAVNHNIPVKIFVYSNEGYGIIRQFQDLYMGGRHVGTHEGTPNFARIAQAYGINSIRVDDPRQLRMAVKEAMAYDGPILVDIVMRPESLIAPRAIFGKPIEEQHPYLSDDEVINNLHVKRWQKS